MKIINTLKRIDLISFGLLFFSFFPLIPNKVKGFTVILLLLLSFTQFKKKKIQCKSFIINSSLYFVFLLSNLIFYEEGGESKQVLETCLSILVIPLIFYLLIPSYNFEKKLLYKFIKNFVLSTSIYTIIIMVFIVLDTDTYYYSNWYSNKARKLIEEIPLISQHPIYASIFSAITILFLLKLLKFKGNKFCLKDSLFYTCCLILNCSFLILLSSRGVIISLLVSILIYFFLKIKKIKYKLSLVLVFSIIIISFFQFNRRMNELIKIETYIEVNSNYSNSYRYQTYKCAYELLKNKIITGYGVGNAQLKLNVCYLENGAKTMVDKYNTHNQYLDIILKTGIFGLTLFLFFLFSNFLIGKKSKNNLVIVIIIFYSIVFLTENLLLRQSGVILFYFLVLFLNKFNFNLEGYIND